MFPILTYSLSTIMAALHSSSVSLNMSVMFIFVLTVARLSYSTRFPNGLKSISFDVGSIFVDVKLLSPRRLMSIIINLCNFMLMFHLMNLSIWNFDPSLISFNNFSHLFLFPPVVGHPIPDLFHPLTYRPKFV